MSQIRFVRHGLVFFLLIGACGGSGAKSGGAGGRGGAAAASGSGGTTSGAGGSVDAGVTGDGAPYGVGATGGFALPDAATGPLSETSVTPVLSTSAAATALVTPEAGGTLSLVDGSGVKLTFAVEPGNVMDPVAVTMRLVTGFSKFPSAAPQTAVMFEPDGFAFPGAGLLTVTYPTVPSAADVTSFAFAADGSSFYLKPALVVDKEVRIPFAHFSGGGTGVWQPTERAVVAAQQLGDGLMRVEQQAADALRMGQPIKDLYQAYYDANVAPLIAAAAHDCSLSRALLPHILGLAHQQALLGTTDGAGSDFAKGADVQAWTCNCLKEANDSCRAGKINAQTLLNTWLAMERQAQVLGLGDVGTTCGLGSSTDLFVNGAAHYCAAEWTGTLSYSTSGQTTTTAGTSTNTASLAQSFKGDLVDGMLTDSSTTTQGSNVVSHEEWSLVFSGPSAGTFTSTTTDTLPGDCGPIVRSVSEQGGGNQTIKMAVTFSIDGDALQTFNINTATNADGSNAGTLGFTARGANTTTIPGCDGGAGSSFVSEQSEDVTLHPLSPSKFSALVFTRKSSQVIEGSVTEVRAGAGYGGVDANLTWKFSLHRRGS